MAGDELYRRWPTDRPSSGLGPKGADSGAVSLYRTTLPSAERERERERLRPPVEELDLERAVGDRPLLSNELEHPLLVQQPGALGVRDGDPLGVGARYISAVGSEHYATAFSKMLKDPTNGHLRFSKQEVEAVRTATNAFSNGP